MNINDKIYSQAKVLDQNGTDGRISKCRIS